MLDFANHAALALTISGARRSVTELAMFADRKRIAHDLHDQVIQRVFAVGMDLQSVTARIKTPELTARLGRSIDELHADINDIRTTIFDLTQRLGARGGVEKRLRDAFARLTQDRDIAARPHRSRSAGPDRDRSRRARRSGDDRGGQQRVSPLRCAGGLGGGHRHR